MLPNLSQLIHHSSALDSVSVTEIEELMVKAPSSDSYRVLLDKKMSRQQTHDSVLAGADKMLLSNFFFNKENFIEAEITSLINESNIDNSSEVIENIVASDINDNNDDFGQQDDDVSESLMDETVENIHADEIMPEVVSDTTTEEVLPLSINANDEESIVEEKSEDQIPNPSKKPSKKNKTKQKSFKLKEYSGISEYAKWLLAFKKVDVEKQIRKEEKAAKKRALEASAKKSVTKSDLIASEPLAEILAIQGHFDDAKKMYEQLMHKYPEKSSYFAAKINNLLKI